MFNSKAVYFSIIFKSRWKYKIEKKLQINYTWKRLHGEWSQITAKRTSINRQRDPGIPSNVRSLLAWVALKMFARLIYFKICTLNGICKENAVINCIICQDKEGSFPSNLTGHTALVNKLFLVWHPVVFTSELLLRSKYFLLRFIFCSETSNRRCPVIIKDHVSQWCKKKTWPRIFLCFPWWYLLDRRLPWLT
jgi:hypothetical protein